MERSSNQHAGGSIVQRHVTIAFTVKEIDKENPYEYFNVLPVERSSNQHAGDRRIVQRHVANAFTIREIDKSLLLVRVPGKPLDASTSVLTNLKRAKKTHERPGPLRVQT